MGLTSLRSVRVAFFCLVLLVLAALALGACTSVLGDFTLGNEPSDSGVPADGGHPDGAMTKDTGPSTQDAPRDTMGSPESSVAEGGGETGGDSGPAGDSSATGDSTTTGGGDASGSYTVGGTVSGLAPGDSVTLQDNGGDDKMVSANGSFTFATSLSGTSSYKVTVLTEPGSPSQTCTVANGTGTVSANVTTVTVTCTTDTFSISGMVTGLSATDMVTLQDNGASNLAVDTSGGGAFTFTDTVASGMPYAVMVLTQPAGLTCTVMNGMGTVTNANITNVQVTCVPNVYTIGGTLSGLPATTTVILQDNTADSLTLNANGAFKFTTPLMTGQGYAVTISSQPNGGVCTVSSATGTVSGANVMSVVVNCSMGTYTIGGTVSGLAGGESFPIQDNGMAGTQIFVSANGTFSFATPVPTGTMYNVTVTSNPQSPVAQTCTVTTGTGTVASANVTSITITCTTNVYTIGGMLSGLSSGSVVLQLNAANNVTVSSNASFMFPPQPSGLTYNVTVLTQPQAPSPSQTCTVTNGNGTLGAGNINNVSVSCVASYFASYSVNNGPNWNSDPQSVSCVTACGTLFGAGPWGCSTIPTTLNHLAFGSQYGSGADCTNGVADSYSLQGPCPSPPSTVGPCPPNFGYYNCRVASPPCSFSAYVNDNCSPSVTNYCWRL
jgi:hypothetical protein